MLFKEYDHTCIRKRRGALLPHWEISDAIYHVIYRLADSIPAKVKKYWASEKSRAEKVCFDSGVAFSTSEKSHIRSILSLKYDEYLDAGYGDCILRQPEIADMVYGNLNFFNNDRYRLLAWSIMPNHVHVMVQPIGEFRLSSIVYSWKSFTAHRINSMLGREGSVWQKEYFDRIIRDGDDLMRTIDYVYDNPDKVGLVDWKWRWKEEVVFE